MRFRYLIVLVLGWASALSIAHAHSTVSQHGTLNIVGDSAFMVLSLPVSAFKGIDDNGDGLLSVSELRVHSASIELQIKQGVQLENSRGISTLGGLMLNTAPPEHDYTAPAKQMVVLGRYDLDSGSTGIKFTMRMFGVEVDERTEQITVTKGARTQILNLTPENPTVDVLPPLWRRLMDKAQLAAAYILSLWRGLVVLNRKSKSCVPPKQYIKPVLKFYGAERLSLAQPHMPSRGLV